MNPRSFNCVSCETKCSVSQDTSDDFSGSISCFKCTTNHKVIRCERCERGIVVGEDDEITKRCTEIIGIVCRCRFCKSELLNIDGKFQCSDCISAKQLASAKKFSCTQKSVQHTSGSYFIDLNEAITTNLCIDISRKLDIIIDEKTKEISECRKEISELRSLVVEMYNMIKFSPLLKGPEVTETTEHFCELKSKLEL